MNTTTTLLNPEDILNGPLGASSLACPLRRLVQDLNGLVRDGHLQGVDLDLTHQDCPCFLLSVGADKPQFYVELFMGGLDDGFDEDEDVPLCVLMNWLGSDAEPAFWETDWEWETARKANFVGEPDFGEVLSHILFMTD